MCPNIAKGPVLWCKFFLKTILKKNKLKRHNYHPRERCSLRAEKLQFPFHMNKKFLLTEELIDMLKMIFNKLSNSMGKGIKLCKCPGKNCSKLFTGCIHNSLKIQIVVLQKGAWEIQSIQSANLTDLEGKVFAAKLSGVAIKLYDLASR